MSKKAKIIYNTDNFIFKFENLKNDILRMCDNLKSKATFENYVLKASSLLTVQKFKLIFSIQILCCFPSNAVLKDLKSRKDILGYLRLLKSFNLKKEIN